MLPSSCRDRGWTMWMGGGLVPVLCHHPICWGFVRQTDHIRTKDRHKAPALPLIRPLSLQVESGICSNRPIRSLNIRRARSAPLVLFRLARQP